MTDDRTVECLLCNRDFSRRQLTKHHCKPRQKGGTRADIELLCPQCHGMIHATYTNQTLAALYPTIGQLRFAPELQPFLKWVRKQPPSARSRNVTRKQRV